MPEHLLGINLEQWVQECVDATIATPVDQNTQADLLYAISLFGSLVHNSKLYERIIPEELMRESKFYQRQVEKITRETTIKHILTLLKSEFQAEAVNDLTPSLQNITDLQRLEQLLLAATKAQSLDAFVQMLSEQEQPD